LLDVPKSRTKRHSARISDYPGSQLAPKKPRNGKGGLGRHGVGNETRFPTNPWDRRNLMGRCEAAGASSTP